MITPDTAQVIAARDVVRAWGSTRVLTDVNFQIGRGLTGLLGSKVPARPR